MTKYHLKHRSRGWKFKLVINLSAAILSGVVVGVLVVAKFGQGAWTIVILFPALTILLIRLNRQYRNEAQQLEQGALEASEMPVLRHHVLLVFVDRLDLATARAIQYGRSLDPDEIRAVHFFLDNQVAKLLKENWERLMIRRLPLEIRECRDRRLGRAAVDLVANALAGGDTEVTVLLPRRVYSWGWGHLLHDRTADQLAAMLGRLPHATATVVPFQVGKGRITRKAIEQQDKARRERTEKKRRRDQEMDDGAVLVEDAVPIGETAWRQKAKIAGRVSSVEVQPWRGAQVLSCTLTDRSGSMTLVFTRRDVPGVETGAHLVAEGTIGEHDGRLAMLNPLHEVLKRTPFDPIRG